MTKTKGFLLTAGIVLATTFTLSCSSDDDKNDGGYTGSYGSVSYSAKIYKTVKIGTQTWFAENLNYAPGTGNSACYDNRASNCATYGRLYDWSTAMGFASSCNSASCSSQIQSKHKGICPSGWHIPSGGEWNVLMNYVGGFSTAGKHLKSKSGWNSYSGIKNLDTYGFSALPGGYSSSDGSFSFVGDRGFWWGVSEGSGSGAYRRLMFYNGDGADWGDNQSKSGLYSVRCIKD
jgi:uncharacterized protein (TIGR02145 family)